VLTPEEEKQYKETLYLLLEKVRATKASFYLVEPNGSFRLLSYYGFSRADRFPDKVQKGDPLATRVHELREPSFVNDVRLAGKLGPLMEGASSTRILTAPLYLDGRIVGILDVRDKAAREPFTTEDLPWVNEVLRRLAAQVKTIPRFASAGPTSDEGESPFEFGGSAAFRIPAGAGTTGVIDFEPNRLPDTPVIDFEPARYGPVPPGLAPPPSAEPELSTAHLPSGTARTMRLVQETVGRAATPARSAASARRAAAEREAGFYKLYLETCLHLPDVELAAISTLDGMEAEIVLGSRRALAGDVEPALVENLEKILARSGAAFPMPMARTLQPFRLNGPERPPLTRAEIVAIQSSVLSVSPESVSVLSLVFRQGPGAEGRESLKNVHLLVKNSLGEIRGAARYRDAYRNLVNKLLEPGLKKYSALKSHSFNVGRLARRFALALRLSPVEIEQITVAGILHDVGMRELNYDELYAKRTLTEDELKLVKEHPRAGAFLLEEVPWPYPVVPLVKHHHERWDGAGYPDGLRAEQIPFGARLIHLCEAFDAMTSPSSYRSVLPIPQALDILVSKGGTQFDPELAPAFRKMIESFRTDER